jgi:CHAT domain-containing protein
METEQYLQYLRDHTLEEGRAYIQTHASEKADYASFGDLFDDEALKQLYTNPAVSLKLAELLIYFGEHVHHPLSHALGLRARGDALRAIGLHQAAIECLDTAGGEFLRLGDEGNWARSRISWIISSAWLGCVEEALQEAARARDVFQRLGENYWACVIDHNTAVICMQVGRYQEALDLYERILAIYPTLTDQGDVFIKRAIAMAKLGEARTLAWIGELEKAQSLMLEALDTIIALGETNLAINFQSNLATLDYAQGYYGSALQRYYQARDNLEQNTIGDPWLLGILKLRIANCLVKLNRAQEACQLAFEAVEVYRERGISLDTSEALREYATMLVAAGRIEEAVKALDEAGTLYIKGGFAYHAAITKLQQSELLFKMGSFAAAYDQARVLKEYFEAQGLVARSVRASLVMVDALIENAKADQLSERQATLLQEAVFLCKRAALQAHQYNLQEEVYKSQYLLGQLFTLQKNFTKASRHYAAAIVQIERMLDDLVYDLSPSFLHTAWIAYEDMIALCLQQSQDERAFAYLERARSMALRQYLNRSKALHGQRAGEQDSNSASVSQANSAAIVRIQQELENWQARYRSYSAQLANSDTLLSPSIDREVLQHELKRCEAKVSELFEMLYLYQAGTSLSSHPKKRVNNNNKQADILQLRQHLAPGQLLLAYCLYKGKLVIFALTAEHLITYEIPDGVEQLEHVWPLLHARLLPGSVSSQQEHIVRRLLHKLYDLLVAPVASLLPSSGYLTIIPYGPLHSLPFHALYDGSRFLIEDFQINYLPASSILTQLGTHEGDQYQALSGTAQPLVLGYSGSRHLQHALEEAKSLATILDGECYLEGEATITRLIELAPGRPIIHLATHGQSRLDAPNFSSVLLADGQLNAIDVFSLNLQGCELVTLSGCETGLALSGGGDEQLGLGRAFLAAGATSLVMSLWPVEDNATNELMHIFYQHLLQGESKVIGSRMITTAL